GKYTTYRCMAAEMVDKVQRHLAKNFSGFDPSRKSNTQYEPVVFEPDSKQVSLLEEYNNKLELETVQHLQKRYGARWQRVADLAMQDASLRERIIPSEPDILAEAKYSRESEMAVSFEDFLRRRTMLALKAPLAQNRDRLGKAAAIFGEKEISLDRILHCQGLDLK
ncbi:MAG: glycerol-3-phosphate dehydrogenase C-terminal domain-containing protein, partial [Bdellovibrionota bacterium]